MFSQFKKQTCKVNKSYSLSNAHIFQTLIHVYLLYKFSNISISELIPKETIVAAKAEHAVFGYRIAEF